jgi:3-phosphoshikimate 1-carboxyvinyltransferase
MPLASAQVKSAILLAGLYPDGKTKVIEPIKTRDHTERMLRLFKAEIKVKENTVVIKGGRPLVSPGSIYLPGDISSASFFVVAASLVPGSRVLIKNVSLNPTRAGSIRVLKRMGADIKIRSTKSKMHNYEPSGDIIIKAHPLRGTVIRRREIPSLIDELPILMVAASLARGTSIFNGIGELRVKETDRIKSMSENLKKMGAQIKLSRVGNTERIILQGASRLRGAKVRSFGDHRTALSMVVAGLAAQGQTVIDDISCIAKSFPDFLVILDKLLKRPLKNYSLHR